MTAARPDTAPARQALLRVLAEILPDVATDEVTDEMTLDDLGADSVDRVEIITALVHLLDRTDPISSFADLPDIGSLLRRVTDGSTP
ncbi:MAG TPA: phosphopantetheine-binding protein [Pseudonocardiaceae bacterium]